MICAVASSLVCVWGVGSDHGKLNVVLVNFRRPAVHQRVKKMKDKEVQVLFIAPPNIE